MVTNNNIKITELKSIYDNARSFYKKAKVLQNNNILILKSYNTNICEYNTATKKLKMIDNSYGYYGKFWVLTNTTCRHIKEFLKQFTNITANTKKDIEKLYN